MTKKISIISKLLDDTRHMDKDSKEFKDFMEKWHQDVYENSVPLSDDPEERDRQLFGDDKQEKIETLPRKVFEELAEDEKLAEDKE